MPEPIIFVPLSWFRCMRGQFFFFWAFTFPFFYFLSFPLPSYLNWLKSWPMSTKSVSSEDSEGPRLAYVRGAGCPQKQILICPYNHSPWREAAALSVHGCMVSWNEDDRWDDGKCGGMSSKRGPLRTLQRGSSSLQPVSKSLIHQNCFKNVHFERSLQFQKFEYIAHWLSVSFLYNHHGQLCWQTGASVAFFTGFTE